VLSRITYDRVSKANRKRIGDQMLSPVRFLDVDGTVTGEVGTYIAPPYAGENGQNTYDPSLNAIDMTSLDGSQFCKYDLGWNAVLCKGFRYVTLDFYVQNMTFKGAVSLWIVDAQNPSVRKFMYTFQTGFFRRIPLVANRTYEMEILNTAIPLPMALFTEQMFQYDWVNVRMVNDASCVKGSSWNAAPSLPALLNSTRSTWFKTPQNVFWARFVQTTGMMPITTPLVNMAGPLNFTMGGYIGFDRDGALQCATPSTKSSNATKTISGQATLPTVNTNDLRMF
jgi:hypothetical protein